MKLHTSIGSCFRAALLPFLCLLLVLGVARSAFAYTPPPSAGFVTDTAGVLSAGEVQALDDKLTTYRRCSSNRVVVFIAKSLDGSSVEDVAYAAFNTWKIGDARKDNGVLLLIAPNERKVRIETGKGVGGALTDIESNRILREYVSANMKKNDVFAAVDQGTTEIERALQRDGMPRADGGGECAIAPATRPTPAVTSQPTSPPTSSPPVHFQEPVPSSPESKWTGPITLITFLLFGGAFATLFFSRGKGALGLVFGLFGTLFSGCIGGTVLTALGNAFLGNRVALVLGLIALPLAIVGKILVGRAGRRPFSGSSSGSYDGTSSSYDSSSSSSSWDSSSSSSSSFDSGSSGGGSDYSGGGGSDYSGGGGSDSSGGGSSGGGGSSDSY
jgi:uncharacterized protein